MTYTELRAAVVFPAGWSECLGAVAHLSAGPRGATNEDGIQQLVLVDPGFLKAHVPVCPFKRQT